MNDGSIDNTPKICEELKEKYKNKNIIVIHQENKGSSKAREAGLNASTGEYIAFVDSDDYMDLTAYEKAIKILEENNCDMVQFGFHFVDSKGKISEPPKKLFKVKFDNIHDSLNYFFVGGIYGTHDLWDKVYKRFIFEDIKWPGITTREDSCISVQLFSKAKKFITTDDMIYYYLQHSESVSHQSYLDIARRDDSIKASEFVIDFIEHNFPELLPEALFHPTFGFFEIIMEYLTLDTPDGKKIINKFIYLIRNNYHRMQTELKKQRRKLYMGYDLKYAFKKKIGRWLFTYVPNFTVCALKIGLKLHALSVI